jgi:hypothetical protein
MHLSPAERLDYIRLLILAVMADGRMEAAELERLYELFVLFDIPAARRCLLLETEIRLPSRRGAAGVARQLGSPLLRRRPARIALACDLRLILGRAVEPGVRRELEGLIEAIGLAPEEESLVAEAVDLEQDILRSLRRGQSWRLDERSRAFLGRQAAALGLPLAALTMAGTDPVGPQGLGVALATLGHLSGLPLLGLDPAAAGVGALLLAGVGVGQWTHQLLPPTPPAAATRRRPARLEAVPRIAAEELRLDLPVLTRRRRRECLQPVRRRRRHALRQAMTEALARLEVTP